MDPFGYLSLDGCCSSQTVTIKIHFNWFWCSHFNLLQNQEDEKQEKSHRTLFTTCKESRWSRVWTGTGQRMRSFQFSVEYLPLRLLGNSPTVWESVRSKPTPFALIILGLWPDWWKKTLLITKEFWMITILMPCCNNCSAMQSKKMWLC